jgi:quinol monooxygenase YgiN
MTAKEDFVTASLHHGNLQVDTSDPNPRPMIAVLDARPGLTDAFRERIVELVREVRREPGCVTFTAYEARDTPGRFYLYEIYTDAAAFDAHLKTDHVHRFISLIPSLSTGGPASLVQLNEIPVTDTGAAMQPQSGWSTEYAADTDAPPEAVWAALRDLHTGTKISDRSSSYVIHGPFALGTELTVTPDGMDQALRSTIVEFADGETYADQTEFNGLILTDRHTLTRTENSGTRITHRLEISGPAAQTIGPKIGPNISEDFPLTMDDLIAAAVSRTGNGQSRAG